MMLISARGAREAYLSIDPTQALESMNEGVYITDLDRRILYWNKGAERITGWKAEDVIGSRCRDNILCHVDRHGNRLCVDSHCPLLHAMRRGERVEVPTLVFARGAHGDQIPVTVTTAPYRAPDGRTIGGIEVFREMRDLLKDLETAEQIQRDLVCKVPEPDGRMAFHPYYIQRDFVGGDFYRATSLPGGRYPFLVGDVAGHGLSSGLFTMLMRALWDENRDLLEYPSAFAAAADERLAATLEEDFHFITALFGVFDLVRGEFRYVNAGSPGFFRIASDGSVEQHGGQVRPLGAPGDCAFRPIATKALPGDRFVFCTDGAYELFDKNEVMFGVENLAGLVRTLPRYPDARAFFREIDAALHAYTGTYDLPDDLTIVVAELRPPAG